MSINFGCATVDITPDYPVYLCGYGSRNALTSKVSDKLEAGVMIFEGNGKKTMHITLDNTGISSCNCTRLRSDFAKTTGFPPENIIISCSHTHFASGIAPYYVTASKGQLEVGLYPADEKYYTLILDKITAAIKDAEANMEQVTVEEAEPQLPQLLFNRRTIVKATGMVETNYLYPHKPDDFEFQYADPSLMVWRFRTQDGKIKAILGRFSAHPVTGGGDDGYAISADYPGYFKKYIREYFGCPGFFMLGTNGDAVPLQRRDPSRDDIGNTMARAIRMAERTFKKADDFQVGITKVPINLKLFCTTNRATADEELNQRLDAVRKANKDYDYDHGLLAAVYKHEFVKMYPSDDVTLEMNVVRLGSKILVFLPFEVLTEIGTKIKEACPNAFVISISNGYDGYMPLEKEYSRGGYEAELGPRFHHSAGDEIVQLAIQTIKQL